MRKKLLALLMCATMVLGTGVTAMASTADDAKKIGKENAEKFIAEYYPEDSVIKGDAYNGTNGTVEYGYTAENGASYVDGFFVFDKGELAAGQRQTLTMVYLIQQLQHQQLIQQLHQRQVM